MPVAKLKSTFVAVKDKFLKNPFLYPLAWLSLVSKEITISLELYVLILLSDVK